jgi:hypothetical protein
MKRVFAKIIVLITLIIVGMGYISGTAFAQNTTTHPLATRKHSVQPQVITNSGQDTVVFVHGISPAAFPPSLQGKFGPIEDALTVDCSKYWGNALNFMNATHVDPNYGNLTWGRKDFRTVQFYNSDTNCTNGLGAPYSADLHNNGYAKQCTSYNAGNEGTYNESIYHLSCLFAWYLYDNFGQHAGWNVELVGHSMGGLIIHDAIYQVQNRQQLGTGNTFPPTLGHISDVVTFDSPHQGHSLNAALQALCNLALQCKQMDPNSAFTQEMNTALARDSQAGNTDWTLIGSECDSLVSAQSSVSTWNVGHKVVYTNDNVALRNGACYGHLGVISDETDVSTQDAVQYWCDWEDAGASACNVAYKNFPGGIGVGYFGLSEMLLALWSDQY